MSGFTNQQKYSEILRYSDFVYHLTTGKDCLAQINVGPIIWERFDES